MALVVSQIEKLHARLARALDEPRSVGLREDAFPEPLADLLRSAERTLAQVLIEIREEGPGSQLEVELSQDADRPADQP